MSEAVRAAGVGTEFEWRGKKYRVKEKTPEWTALMDMWLQGQAWDALERMRGVWSQQVFDDRSDRLHARISAGAYSWGSVAMATAMSHPAGMKEGLFLSMRACDDSITRELIEEFWEEHEKKAIDVWMRANPPDPRLAPAAGQTST